MYLFLVALSLPCWLAVLFFSCSEWGLLLVAMLGFLTAVVSLGVENRL